MGNKREEWWRGERKRQQKAKQTRGVVEGRADGREDRSTNARGTEDG